MEKKQQRNIKKLYHEYTSTALSRSYKNKENKQNIKSMNFE